MFDNGAIIKLITKLHLGPFIQKRYLPPGTRATLKLIPMQDEFLLTRGADAAVATYGVYIKSIKARVRSVKLDPQLMQQIKMNLQRSPAIYPTPILSMATQLIPNGGMNWEWDNLFDGKVPKLPTYAIVSNAAFNGSVSHNPFYYRNLDIRSTRIKVDGNLIVPKVKTNFALKDWNEALVQILKATNDKSCLLNSHTWDVKNIWAFDLTPKGTHALTEYYPAKTGNLRIELEFSTAIADGPYTIIFYGLVDSVSEVDALGNVTKSW